MIKQFFPYFKKELTVALFGILFTATVVIIELSQPRLMSTIVDSYIPTKNTPMIIQTGILMALLAILGVIIGLASVICATKASNGFAYNLRQALINKIQTFSDYEMHQLSVSSLITRATNDINFVQSTSLQSLRMLVRAPVMLISAVVMAYFTNKRLSLIIFVAEVILSILLYILLKKAYPLFVAMQKAIDKVNKTLQEGLINIRVIKSFVREAYEEKRFEVSNETLMQASQKANRLIALLNPTMMLVLFSSTLAIMAYGSRLIVIDKNLSVGQLLVFINYMIFTMNSMMMLSMTLTMFSRSKASFVRLAEVLNTEVLIDDKQADPSHTIKHGQIEFDHICFRYNKQSVSADLDDLSFTILAGEKVGFIGSTGSGKTTLIKLLTRLLEADSGTIRMDDQALNTYSLNQLRSVIGVVPQKNILFSGTILDNLRYGNLKLSEDEAWQLLKH
ncbi:MAG: ABC transporter ATP-binding protein, partial [Erysipelotrichaceae bacterium]